MSFFLKLARQIREPLLLAQDRLISAAAARRRSTPPIRERIAGDDPNSASRRVAVYIHFDRDGVVHDYVLHQLRELADANFRITFVSNAPCFPVPSRDRVRPYCRETLWRFNVGYDFGGYKDAIASIDDLARADALLLMNDSVYGPFWKFGETIAAFDCARADIWGITDSLEVRPHLQTFLLYFCPAALRSQAFADFWRAFPYVGSKRWVIRNGEVALTQTLTAHGLRAAALAPYASVVARKQAQIAAMNMADLACAERCDPRRLAASLDEGVAVNPMHACWDVLIADFKCPFIKRDLLQGGSSRVPPASGWVDLIAQRSDYDVSLITEHLDARAKTSGETRAAAPNSPA